MIRVSRSHIHCLLHLQTSVTHWISSIHPQANVACKNTKRASQKIQQSFKNQNLYPIEKLCLGFQCTWPKMFFFFKIMCGHFFTFPHCVPAGSLSKEVSRRRNCPGVRVRGIYLMSNPFADTVIAKFD